jgi:hypothetical protein
VSRNRNRWKKGDFFLLSPNQEYIFGGRRCDAIRHRRTIHLSMRLPASIADLLPQRIVIRAERAHSFWSADDAATIDCRNQSGISGLAPGHSANSRPGADPGLTRATIASPARWNAALFARAFRCANRRGSSFDAYRIDHPWTVATLASEAGHVAIGIRIAIQGTGGAELPLEYLTRWRMHRASHLLREAITRFRMSRSRWATIRTDQFHKAFKRIWGSGLGSIGGSMRPPM